MGEYWLGPPVSTQSGKGAVLETLGLLHLLSLRKPNSEDYLTGFKPNNKAQTHSSPTRSFYSHSESWAGRWCEK